MYTEFSLGGGARSLPDHSQRWLEDKGAWETPVGDGPLGLREGLVRSAPWMVCCCPDRVCCRKSAPLYLEPCSGERAAEITHYPGLAPSHDQDQKARHSMHRTQQEKRRNRPGFSQQLRGTQPPPAPVPAAALCLCPYHSLCASWPAQECWDDPHLCQLHWLS